MEVYDWIADREFRAGGFTFFFVGIVVPTVLGVLMYRYQIRQLELKQIPTKFATAEVSEIVAEIAKRNNWEVKHNTKTFIMLRTHPPFWSGSWGEQITLLFDDGTVWVNSICDPNKRTSIVSMGRNKENIQTLAYALNL